MAALAGKCLAIDPAPGNAEAYKPWLEFSFTCFLHILTPELFMDKGQASGPAAAQARDSNLEGSGGMRSQNSKDELGPEIDDGEEDEADLSEGEEGSGHAEGLGGQDKTAPSSGASRRQEATADEGPSARAGARAGTDQQHADAARGPRRNSVCTYYRWKKSAHNDMKAAHEKCYEPVPIQAVLFAMSPHKNWSVRGSKVLIKDPAFAVINEHLL
jgi:hypothetical protein